MVKTRKNQKKTRKHVFTKKDFVSGDGMMVSLWGPPMWHFLHTMSFNYPVNPTQEDKVHYRDFVLSLQYVLPCKYCRQNLKTNFKSMPLTMAEMKDRESFSRYIYELHELVNRMLKKKSNLTYCDVRERYEHFRARCSTVVTTVEKGCTESLYGKKSKCVLKIVPQETKCKTFQMNRSCKKRRIMV